MSRTASVSEPFIDRMLLPAALATAALLVGVGALLHPHVPGAPAAAKLAVRTSTTWVLAHVLLTLGQLLAAVALPLALHGRAVPERARRLRAGTRLLGLGLAVGALGTLAAATALAAAATAPAEGGGTALFRVVNEGTLGLGWLMLAATSLGGVLAGSAIAPTARGVPKAAAIFGVAGGVAGLAGVLVTAVPFLNEWLHAYVLRWGALYLALVIALVAWASAEA